MSVCVCKGCVCLCKGCGGECPTEQTMLNVAVVILLSQHAPTRTQNTTLVAIFGSSFTARRWYNLGTGSHGTFASTKPLAVDDGRPREMVLPFSAVGTMSKQSKPRKCERHWKVYVSAMRHRAHESAKARVQKLRCAKKGTDKPPRNKPQERGKAVAEQTNLTKKHNQRTVESHRSRVEQNQGDNREPEHATWREHGFNHRHGNLHTTRRQRQRHRVHKTHELRHGTHRSQAQEPDFGRNQETRNNDGPGRFCQRQTQGGITGSRGGTTRPAAAATEKHLRPRTAKIQSLEAAKQQLASEIQKRLGGGRDGERPRLQPDEPGKNRNW